MVQNEPNFPRRVPVPQGEGRHAFGRGGSGTAGRRRMATVPGMDGRRIPFALDSAGHHNLIGPYVKWSLAEFDHELT
jgi:hypothetical protein